MTRGTVDRATAAMVPAFLSIPKPQPSFEWGRVGALAFTTISLFTNHTSFAANPTPDRILSGLWGEFASGAAGYTHPESRAALASQGIALDATKARASDISTLSEALRRAQLDPSYHWWLEWHAKYELVEHSARLNGLIDPQFSTEVADVVGLPHAEILQFIDKTQDVSTVAILGDRVLKGSLQPEDLYMLDAWLASTMIRGLFHDELSRVRKRQHYRHPIRALADRQNHTPRPRICFEPSPAQRYFAAILLGISFKASKDVYERVRLFNINMIKAKAAIKGGHLALGDHTSSMTNVVGLERAVREAQSLIRAGQLDTAGKTEKAAIDISVGLAATGIGFTLSPWMGAVVGASSAIMQALTDPGDRLSRRRRSSRRNIHGLAQAVAGSVDIATSMTSAKR